VGEPHQEFQLANDIDRYLAVLSKVYRQDGKRQKQEIIVNSRVRIHEKWTTDGWDGGTYGHALDLIVPEKLYLNLVNERNAIQDEIRDDINRIHNVRNEFIAEVLLEIEDVKDRDWRRESGVLHSHQHVATPAATERIWTESAFRLFLSHKSDVKKEAAKLKRRLAPFGVCAFVAHTDINPTEEWQDEIKNALASMDAFVALLTEDFHESEWTDQEVGYAFGRGVPLIAVKLGRDPYGFIGRFQALACDWPDAPLGLIKLLIRNPQMLDAYLNSVPQCESFVQGNALAEALPFIKTLTEQQAERLVLAYNTNPQLQGSFGFNGTYLSQFGVGLAGHLTRAVGREYVMRSSGQIKLKNR
jgi:hypothetical protein